MSARRELLMCSVATGIGALGCYLLMRYTTEKSKLATQNETAAVAAALTAQGSEWSTQLVKPPLPTEVKNLLAACSLCYLSTTGATGVDPHLSLMVPLTACAPPSARSLVPGQAHTGFID